VGLGGHCCRSAQIHLVPALLLLPRGELLLRMLLQPRVEQCVKSREFTFARVFAIGNPGHDVLRFRACLCKRFGFAEVTYFVPALPSGLAAADVVAHEPYLPATWMHHEYQPTLAFDAVVDLA